MPIISVRGNENNRSKRNKKKRQEKKIRDRSYHFFEKLKAKIFIAMRDLPLLKFLVFNNQKDIKNNFSCQHKNYNCFKNISKNFKMMHFNYAMIFSKLND